MGVFKRWIKSKNGFKTAYWYIRYSFNGKDHWESVGKVGEVTKSVAQSKLDRKKRRIKKGIYDYNEENVTLETLEKDYIDSLNAKQLRTVEQRKRHLKVLKSFFSNKKIFQISPKDIDEYKTFRLKTLKPSSVNRELAVLRNIINMAKRWKMFYGENPVSISGLLTENNQRDRVLSFEEEDKLFISSAEHLKPVLSTALNTGMRKGEILSLTWDEVDFKNNVLIIRAANSKSKKTRRIPMNSVLRTMFLELKANTSWFDKKLIDIDEDDNYVFRDNLGRPVKDIKTAFKNACRRADIKGLRFHDLRHTAGTRMNEYGVGIVAISEILGHSSIDITKRRYIHPGESLRDAVEMLASNEKSCSKKRSNERDILS